jgi:hypothetical protein
MRAQRCCRLPARIALAAMLAAMGLAAVSVGALAADNGLTLTVHVGYQDVVKAGDWMPVTIDAKNTGAGVDGTLEVQEALNGQPGVTGLPVYHQSISLATGSSKRIRTYVTVDTTGATITARIVQNGRVIVSKDAASASTTSTMIGVLSDQATSLDGFAAVHPASVAARVVHLRADEIAESAILLRAFDILAIDDFATDSLTAGQRTAISDFVRSGGDLLLGTGAAWRKTLAGLPPAILPMTVSGTTSVTTALLGGSPVEVATGTQTAGPAWLSTGTQPLLLERGVGAGLVTLATFDWNQEPVAGWSGTAPLLRQLIARAVFGPGSSSQGSPYASGGMPSIAPFGGGSQPTIASRSGTLSSTLGNIPELALPSLQLTGALVLLYVLLVGPVNYLVLGAMRRRALAWVTVPLIAIIAAGGAYGAGVLTKGRSVQANQVTILHLQPGSDRAYQETYTGIMAPTRGDYQASVSGGRLLISPIVNNGAYDMSTFGSGSRSGLRIDVDSNNVTLPGMTAFVLSGFATESMTSAPQLAAQLQLANGKLTGTIENHSNLAFTDAVLIMGDSFQTFGALKPGTSATVSLDVKLLNQFGQPTYTRIYGNAFFNGPQPNQPTDSQREDYAKTQILSLLPIGGTFKGISLSSTPLLVAWTHQAFQDLTVNGSHPRSTAQTAVALSLPLDHIGTGSLPAGVVSGRIVDVVGDTQGQGPPGMLLMQSGSVTYEFSPSLAAGRHLTGAALNGFNPYGGKFAPAPGGGTSTSTMQSEVWDWSRSAWSEVAYQDNGTTSLPDSAVNPQNGLVRLRLSTNGGFAAGAISLSGTVQ